MNCEEYSWLDVNCWRKLVRAEQLRLRSDCTYWRLGSNDLRLRSQQLLQHIAIEQELCLCEL